jgi:hypothetical protein
MTTFSINPQYQISLKPSEWYMEMSSQIHSTATVPPGEMAQCTFDRRYMLSNAVLIIASKNKIPAF